MPPTVAPTASDDDQPLTPSAYLTDMARYFDQPVAAVPPPSSSTT